jgi:hypothetical protein
MNVFFKKMVKPLQTFSIFTTLILLNNPVYANELQKDSKLYASNLMKPYHSSASDSFYWNHDYKTKLQSQINARQSSTKRNTLVERLAAISLGIVMEFTTNDTYNEVITQ